MTGFFVYRLTRFLLVCFWDELNLHLKIGPRIRRVSLTKAWKALVLLLVVLLGAHTTVFPPTPPKKKSFLFFGLVNGNFVSQVSRSVGVFEQSLFPGNPTTTQLEATSHNPFLPTPGFRTEQQNRPFQHPRVDNCWFSYKSQLLWPVEQLATHKWPNPGWLIGIIIGVL